MITNPFFLLSILISAVFTFFTFAFVIELALVFVSDNQYRVKANVRMLAFFSLLLEFSFHSFGKYNFLNPLSCYSCFQDLILMVFFPELRIFLTNHEIPLISYLAVDSYQGFFGTLFIGWVLITIFMVLRWISKIYWSRKWLKYIIHSSKSSHRSIHHADLVKALKSEEVTIFVNQEITVPLATYNRKIVLPQYIIDDLSQEEFESIVAHELEHIKTGDPIIRLLTDGLSAFFWWIPTSWYKRKIEKNQEMACDKVILYYGYDSSIYASALIKVSKKTNETKRDFVCSLTGKENSIMSRFQVILGIDAPPKESIFLAGIIVGIEGFVLSMCLTML